MPKNQRNRHRKARQWRDIDVSDAEGLSLQKTERELKGGSARQKRNEDLFYEDVSFANVQLPAEERKRRAREKLTHVDQVMLPNPYTKGAKGASVPQPKKRKLAQLTPAPTAPQGDEDGMEVEHKGEFFDLWSGAGATQPKEAIPEGPKDVVDLDPQWFQPASKKVKVRELVKTSDRRAIEIAHAGASYNPAADDHQELLAKAVSYHIRRNEKEKVIEKQNKHSTEHGVQEATDDLLDDLEVKDESEADVKEEEKAHVNLPWVPAKTPQDRKKEARRLFHNRQLKKSELNKKKKANWLRFDKLVADVDEDEAEAEQLRQVKAQLKASRRDFKIKRLSKFKFPTTEPQYLMSNQIPDSLRKLPVKFSLMRDRFSSLQKRNIIETRFQRNKRAPRYAPKIVTKFSSRRDEAPVV